ncbi:MAG: hypothetical protein US42_C0002G0044 [Candidatus Magasanikbacteria bacterium GW2011_GWC2_37_14]|uniref:Uncharacterized protein n=1 Tax=Candidatus Magasanikbacteria bacterium GW2011_GWC2_37_14 TaxID=1619046 RepID=A0A0G0IVD2_9BACT|nr:MAG: hypothetical protein US42_C0002G0044 [Candidatus Magasanikbacteria bacterium GW2011_GWC2_37_14]
MAGKPKQTDYSERMKWALNFSQQLYDLESGTKIAVDTGYITFDELVITTFINDLCNEHDPYPVASEQKKIFGLVAQLYSKTEDKILEIWERRNLIPRAAETVEQFKQMLEKNREFMEGRKQGRVIFK